MSDYNIQMHEYNGNGYDNLYPKTKAKNVYLTDEYTLEDFWENEIPKPILNDNSFKIIRKVSDAGMGASYWSVGDRKAVTLNGKVGCRTFSNETFYMSVLSFSHNTSVEGANRIHFQFGWNALTGGVQIAFTDSYGSPWVYSSGTREFVMNKTTDVLGGWNNSYMRTTICANFKNALPSDLQNVLKTVTKYTDNTRDASDTASYVTATIDTIFLLAEFEIFGIRTYANSAEQNKQVQYDYYKGVSAGTASKNAFSAPSKIRYNDKSTSQAVYWWERSPVSSNGSFCIVNYNGYNEIGNTRNSNGFAPCLCI